MSKQHNPRIAKVQSAHLAAGLLRIICGGCLWQHCLCPRIASPDDATLGAVVASLLRNEAFQLSGIPFRVLHRGLQVALLPREAVQVVDLLREVLLVLQHQRAQLHVCRFTEPLLHLLHNRYPLSSGCMWLSNA